MITIDEAEGMLNELADALPPAIFEGLTGGVNLLPEEKLSPHAVAGDLYILGEYHNSKMIGRYITLYFGSFLRTHGHLTPKAFRLQLRHTLYHELTHHLESLAGEKQLAVDDAQKLGRYLEEHKRRGT